MPVPATTNTVSDSIKRPSFEIDERLTVMIDFDLAVELGNFILDHGAANKAVYAFGIRLKKMGDRNG